jgi:NAD(P)H-nitrite reductase large subunit
MKDEEIIICRCEDVTLKDIKDAIKEGYTDMESLKRHLQIGTGPCQGKTCIPLTEKILARELHKKMEEVGVVTSRPPESPVPFGIFKNWEKKNGK